MNVHLNNLETTTGKVKGILNLLSMATEAIRFPYEHSEKAECFFNTLLAALDEIEILESEIEALQDDGRMIDVIHAIRER